MIETVHRKFVPGDVVVYIPKVRNGVHPVIIHENKLHICNNRLRERIITSIELPFEPISWQYFGEIENKNDRFLPSVPVANAYGHGTLVLTLSGQNGNWLIGLKIPTSGRLNSSFGNIDIEQKFLVKTECTDIIGTTPSSKPNCPDITLQDEANLMIHHHSVTDGRLLSEQTFKRSTIFPTYPRCSTKQVAYNGENIMAFTTDSGKYEFLWPIELPSEFLSSSNWMIEWDERPGFINVYDGVYYNIVDLGKKEVVASEKVEKLGYGFNSTLYESNEGGLRWIKRVLKNNKKAVSIHNISTGKFESIDFIKSNRFGDLFLFGQDTNENNTVKLLIPNPYRNEMKIIEFTGLTDSVYYSELDEESGELHLFSDTHHFKTAPLQRL